MLLQRYSAGTIPLVMVGCFKKRVALLLVLLLGFAQINVAIAACSMDRGMLAHEMTVGTDGGQACDGCSGVSDRSPNICVAHCTSDLQADTVSVTLVRVPADAPVLSAARAGRVLPGRSQERALSSAPPLRVLLHSFLI